jgi:hypothetical protein
MIPGLQPLINDAQRRFADLLYRSLLAGTVPPDRYVRYLSMQYHLTRGVHRYFITAAAHSDLAKRKRLRKFLIDFANEEELHYLVAANDLYKMGTEPLTEPFDVTLWHAYFERIIVERPFIRLGAACILENIAAGVARDAVMQALSAPYLTRDNTKFLVLHQHETLPHGEQIMAALDESNLESRHIADLLNGACKGTVLYLRMVEWALDVESLATVADLRGTGLHNNERQAVESFLMTDLATAATPAGQKS